ncbi:hypothetical protein C8F04DRAFT_1194975 [Mycena alexandri]|uniref:Uncharacterized protein n=1 Tax=Mycena alexandri TaxID=1745969 RepID=A0AAD6SAG9_9AGAR|nr:hypothetical protein C8F04DRAFT_1194975 [Mycena alexandri]
MGTATGPSLASLEKPTAASALPDATLSSVSSLPAQSSACSQSTCRWPETTRFSAKAVSSRTIDERREDRALPTWAATSLRRGFLTTVIILFVKDARRYDDENLHLRAAVPVKRDPAVANKRRKNDEAHELGTSTRELSDLALDHGLRHDVPVRPRDLLGENGEDGRIPPCDPRLLLASVLARKADTERSMDVDREPSLLRRLQAPVPTPPRDLLRRLEHPQNNIFTAQYWCKYYTGGGTSLPVRLGYPHTNIIPAGVPAYPYGWGTRIQILYRLGYPPTRTAGVPAYKYYTGWGTRLPVRLGVPAYKYYTGWGTRLPVRLGYLHTNIIPASAHYQLGQVTVTALPLSPIFVSEASHNLGGSLPPVLGASHIMAGSLPKVTNTGSNLQWEACLG